MNSSNQFVIRSLRGKCRVRRASSTQFNWPFLRDHFGIQSFPENLKSVVFVIASVMNSSHFPYSDSLYMYVQPRLSDAGHSIVFRRLIRKHGYVIPEASGNEGWEEVLTGRLVVDFTYFEGVQFRWNGICEMSGEIFEIIKDDGVPDVPREWLEQRVKEAKDAKDAKEAKALEEKKMEENVISVEVTEKPKTSEVNGESYYAGLTLSPPPKLSNPDKKSQMPSSRFFRQFSTSSKDSPSIIKSPFKSTSAGNNGFGFGNRFSSGSKGSSEKKINGLMSNPMSDTIRSLSSNLSSLKSSGLKPPMLKPKQWKSPDDKSEEKEESNLKESSLNLPSKSESKPESNESPPVTNGMKKRRLADDIEEVEEVPVDEIDILNINYPLFSLDPLSTDFEDKFKDVMRSPFAIASKRKVEQESVETPKEPTRPRKRRLQKIRYIEDDCPICLIELKEAEERGLLECKHRFCFSCISDWSQVTNLCPCCKGEFSYILKLFQGKQEKILVENKRLEVSEDESELDDTCYRCGGQNDEENMILCDFCNFMCAHYYCVGLRRIPRGQWFCDTCRIDLRTLDDGRVRRGRRAARLLDEELGPSTSTPIN